MANVLTLPKQVECIEALVEGRSIRAVERRTGVHRDTIMRLGVRVGEGVSGLLDPRMSVPSVVLPFSKNTRHKQAFTDLSVAWHGWCRVESPGVTPAMELGLTNHVWGVADMIAYSHQGTPSQVPASDPVPPMTPRNEPLTHRAACHIVARYMMRRLRWCDIAVVEVEGRSTGEPPAPPDVATHPYGTKAWWDYQREYTAWRKTASAGGGRIDVLAFTLPGWKPELKRCPRIVAVEVKTARPDLLTDLRKRKLLRYEPQATHVYLAITDATMLVEYVHWPCNGDVWLADLTAKGLPRHWGVIHIPETGDPQVLRRAGRNPHACEPTDDLRTRLALKAAISLAHRQARASPCHTV